MTVTVLLFASYADALGAPSLPVTVPSPATVGALVEHVRALPEAAALARRLPARPLVAVNAAYAGPEHVLAEGDEVAFIPPVAGG